MNKVRTAWWPEHKRLQPEVAKRTMAKRRNRLRRLGIANGGGRA